MKLYGSKRQSRLICRYGCCASKEAKVRKYSVTGRAARKAAKHRARREGKALTERVR